MKQIRQLEQEEHDKDEKNSGQEKASPTEPEAMDVDFVSESATGAVDEKEL